MVKRKFGGKNYTLGRRTANKRSADQDAASRRKNGYNVRVVKEKGAYSVYTRRK